MMREGLLLELGLIHFNSPSFSFSLYTTLSIVCFVDSRYEIHIRSFESPSVYIDPSCSNSLLPCTDIR